MERAGKWQSQIDGKQDEREEITLRGMKELGVSATEIARHSA